jgi:hypothetical protein
MNPNKSRWQFVGLVGLSSLKLQTAKTHEKEGKGSAERHLTETQSRKQMLSASRREVPEQNRIINPVRYGGVEPHTTIPDGS